jgi:hypothetical protein
MKTRSMSAVAAVLAACSGGATSLRIDVTSPPDQALSSLTVGLVLADGAHMQRTLSLPPERSTGGAVVVILPDVSQKLLVTLHGIAVGGQAMDASASVQARRHAQVELAMALGATPAADGGAAGDLTASADGSVDGGGPMDGGALVDLATPLIARDDFQRVDQSLWGRASDGQLWSGEANSRSAFSISSMAGVITDSSPAGNAYYGFLGPATASANVLVIASMNGPPTFGAIARAQDGNDFYDAEIDGNGLALWVVKNGNRSSLAKANVTFAIVPDTSYSIRLVALGNNLSARIWPTSANEPSTWTVTATDVTFADGMAGVYAVAGPFAASFTRFQCTP